MEYDTDFWNKYTDENESNYHQEYTKLVPCKCTH